MATQWTKEYTPPENTNGGVQYEGGDDINVNTFNIPINNSFWAAEKAQEAVDQVEQNANEIGTFEASVTSRVNDLAEQIVDGEGTQVILNGAKGLKVEYKNENYYLTDTEGNVVELPRTKVFAGTYVGTVESGGDTGYKKPTSLTLPFAPKIIIILESGTAKTFGILTSGIGFVVSKLSSLATEVVRLNISAWGQTCTWTQSQDSTYPTYSLDNSNSTYYYVAIG